MAVLSPPRPTARQRLGSSGEDTAVNHLLQSGYSILERNHRRREGEIDIIAQSGETVAFVEVRTRRGGRMGTAAESISRTKAQRMFGLAEAYAAERPELSAAMRIDLIAIDILEGGRFVDLQHFENAVTGDDGY